MLTGFGLSVVSSCLRVFGEMKNRPCRAQYLPTIRRLEWAIGVRRYANAMVQHVRQIGARVEFRPIVSTSGDKKDQQTAPDGS